MTIKLQDWCRVLSLEESRPICIPPGAQIHSSMHDVRGAMYNMSQLCTNFFVPKKEKLGHVSGTTAALWCPAVLSPGVVASPGFPGGSSPPGFLFFFLIRVVLLRIRGFCDLILEFSTATACGSCLCCFSCTLSSSQDSMH